jgi:hypothetical protein
MAATSAEVNVIWGNNGDDDSDLEDGEEGVFRFFLGDGVTGGAAGCFFLLGDAVADSSVAVVDLLGVDTTLLDELRVPTIVDRMEGL